MKEFMIAAIMLVAFGVWAYKYDQAVEQMYPTKIVEVRLNNMKGEL